MVITYTIRSDYLFHHGIKGQKHGTRRYQNRNGTWTEEGKARRRIGQPRYVKKSGALTNKGRKALIEAKKRNPLLAKEDRDKFGITNFQAEGGTLKKGSTLYRISDNMNEDKTINNRKYFSTSAIDNNGWEKMFGPQFKRYGAPTVQLKYTTVKDLKVSSNAQLGEVFYNDVLKKGAAKIPIDELTKANYSYGFKDSVNKRNITNSGTLVKTKDGKYIEVADGAISTDDDYNVTFNKKYMNSKKDRNETYGSVASSLIAMQCETGRKAVEAMLNAGYDAIPDVNGTDVSYDPIIVLNPDKKMTLTSRKRKRFVSNNVSWPTMRP